MVLLLNCRRLCQEELGIGVGSERELLAEEPEERVVCTLLLGESDLIDVDGLNGGQDDEMDCAVDDCF